MAVEPAHRRARDRRDDEAHENRFHDRCGEPEDPRQSDEQGRDADE